MTRLNIKNNIIAYHVYLTYLFAQNIDHFYFSIIYFNYLSMFNYAQNNDSGSDEDHELYNDYEGVILNEIKEENLCD